jgi:DNA ligase-1
MAGFFDIAALAERMAGEGSRLKKRAEIAFTLGRVHREGGDEDLRLFCLYLAGLPFAESDPRKLNAGGALLTKALLTVSGAGQPELTAAYRRHGDLGAAAHDVFLDHGVGGAGLSLAEVESAFAGMATAKTTAIRAGLVEGMMRQGSALETKYLLKLMLGDMRIGVKESLVEESIAVAACAAGARADVAEVRHAVMLEADLGGAAARAFAGTLGQATMRLFHPLGFMLASPVESPEEAVERFTAKPAKIEPVKKPKRGRKGAAEPEPVDPDGSTDGLLAAEIVAEAGPQEIVSVEAYLEDKYDGMRAQVHCGADERTGAEAGRVAIYSRNREDITESFPELVEAFCAVRSEDGAGLILDGEILGWDFHAGAEDVSAGQALPFAVLGQRIGRKRVDNAIRESVPVVFMAFDLMFAGGELLLSRPLRERRERLQAEVGRLQHVVRSPLTLSEAAARRKHAQGFMFEQEETVERLPRLLLSPACLMESADAIDRAYSEARARANEGVMIKAAGSAYLPGRRGLAWVKLKRVLDTLDVVVTGCEFGSGRKSQFLSDYTFAVRNEDGELRNVGKAYSGVTDAEIAELTEFFKAHTLEDHGHFRTVEPLVIFEVAFNNVMRSDRHASGYALRFPRILRIRTDKPLGEIDTVARVEEVYQSQVDKPAAPSIEKPEETTP